MTPATPFMLEVLRRIQRDVQKVSPPDGYIEAWPFPLQQVKGLEKRGLVERASPTGRPLRISEYVRLTDAGRAAIEPQDTTLAGVREDAESRTQPPVVDLDDLPVLDEVTAAWPLEA